MPYVIVPTTCSGYTLTPALAWRRTGGVPELPQHQGTCAQDPATGRFAKGGGRVCKSEADRFWAKVRPGVDDECWEWVGGRRGKGYGSFKLTRGHHVSAHRYAWELHYGPVPESNDSHPNGMCVCHQCDNRLCVNPKHLFLGTNADNMADRNGKGRCVPLKGEANGDSRLTEAKVRDIRARFAAGEPKVALAREFGVSRTAITYIVIRRLWKHVD